MKTHDFAATYQEGIVVAIDSQTHKIRCKIPALEDLETAWLSYLTPNAGGNKFYCLPDIGELVAVILDARGEGGCVLGALYNAKDKTPASSNNIWKKQFSNGTTIEHDRSTGNITIHAIGSVLVNDCDVVVSGGDVIADGISLKTHVHGGVSPGAATTAGPV